jgi:hypothetical protein
LTELDKLLLKGLYTNDKKELEFKKIDEEEIKNPQIQTE